MNGRLMSVLGRFPEALERHPVLAEIDAVALLELGADPLDDPLVEVVAAQVRVAVGRLDLDDALADFENRNIERAAPEIVHGDRLVLLLVEAVGQRRRRRLVDDAHDFEPGDLAGVFRRLALGVVEVRGDRDDSLADGLTEVLLRGLPELLQNHRGDFRRRVLLAVRHHPRVTVRGADDLIRNHLHFLGDLVVLAAHEALDRINGVLRIGDRLPLRHLADQPLAGLGESDDGRRETTAFRIGDHDRFTALHDCDNRVGGSQVDADDFAH